MALFIEYSHAVQEVPDSIPGWDTTFSDALCKRCKWLWSILYIVVTPTWCAILTQQHAVAAQVRSRMITKYGRSNGSFHRVLACSAGGPGLDSRLRHTILRCSMQRMQMALVKPLQNSFKMADFFLVWTAPLFTLLTFGAQINWHAISRKVLFAPHRFLSNKSPIHFAGANTKYVFQWQMARSKWKWTSIATVPDLCPTTVKILTHIFSRYQVPLISPWEGASDR